MSASEAVEMPHDRESEAGVLGSILQLPEKIAEVESVLRPEDFHRGDHRAVYAAMLALHASGTPPDDMTVRAELRQRGTVAADDIGPLLTALELSVPHPESIRYYAGVVERMAVQRRVLEANATIAAAVYAGNHADPDGLLDWAVALMRDASSGRTARKKPSPYHLLSIGEVLHQPRPDPLIDGYYSLDSTGLTYAPPGVGKTVLLLDQMAHVALDRPWQSHAVKGGHVVYVCAEGQAFLPERLQALMLKLKVEDIPRLHILPARPQLLHPQTVADLLQTFAAELPEAPVWIGFDTVSQTANGARENDADAMGPYLAAMERLREGTRAFVQAIHHTGKDESRGARGSSVFLGNCDTVTYITKVDGTCVWKCEKQRGGWAPFAPFGFTVKSQGFDDYADRTGPYIEACDAPQEATLESPQPKGQTLRVYTVFQSLAEQYGGVYYTSWQKACEAKNIPESTFKDAVRHLRDDFKLVYKPDGSDKWCRTPLREQEGTEGQSGDNDPFLSLEDDPHEEGRKGRSPLRELSLPSLLDNRHLAAASAAGGPP